MSSLKDVLGQIEQAARALIKGETDAAHAYALAALKRDDGARPAPPPVPPGETDAETAALMDAYLEETKRKSYWDLKPKDYPAGQALLDALPTRQVAAVKEVIYRQAKNGPHTDRMSRFDSLRAALLARNLPFTAEDLEWLLAMAMNDQMWQLRGPAIRQARHFAEAGNALTETHRLLLTALRNQIGRYAGDQDSRKHAAVISELLGETDHALPDRGEPWADAARADLDALPPEQRDAWVALFAHAQTSEGLSKPSAKWLKEAEKHTAAVGGEAFDAHVARWLGLFTLPPGILAAQQAQRERWQADGFEGDDEPWTSKPGVSEKNVTLMKGLAWACANRSEPRIARGLAKMAEAALRKIPGVGPWGQRASTAAVYALSVMPCPEAVAQIGRLKTRIAYRPMLKQVESALETAAKRAGMTRDDLEDLAVPTLGFGADGTRAETFGDYAVTATLAADGSVDLAWTGPGGKPLKTVPAEVKREFAEDWKAFKSDADAAEKLLTAQRHRFEAFYLAGRTWRLADWRTRFLEHPLLGSFARRLVWHVASADGQHKGEGLWEDCAAGAAFVDSRGEALPWAADDDATVALWHPLGFPVEHVLHWRERLEEKGVRQPFKQAHREVYLLTDAELNTGTYSNRFAGHLIKQHQFHALAAQRGWQSRLEGGWDGGGWGGAARLSLPREDLCVEFFTEAAGDQISDAGIYLYLSTDQVRFLREGGETPLPLTDVPALVFSEVMRDVDLFVGVCSVGNDPNWRDTGPAGHRGYWEDYAFGDLSASAKTRSDVLSRLLPRLKIAPRCHLDGKFLVVRGDLRTYKIHLGSGNILMEPNDQYLCIVQDRRKDGGASDGVFLPFEGDQRLALILSKAFLLAEDTKIKDSTITSQIKSR